MVTAPSSQGLDFSLVIYMGNLVDTLQEATISANPPLRNLGTRAVVAQ